MTSLEGHREFYARLITAGLPNSPRLVMAFAAVPRERFVGPGPWQILTASGPLETPTSDPAFLYQDVLVALAPERRINNGQPSLHALCLSALDVKLGERVLHIGAGTGYYTAVLNELVGPQGEVIAYEIEEDLARLAAETRVYRTGWMAAVTFSLDGGSVTAASASLQRCRSRRFRRHRGQIPVDDTPQSAFARFQRLARAPG